MGNLNDIITNLIAAGALGMHIALFSGIVFYFTGFKEQVIKLFSKNGIIFAFLLSSSAMLGSLYYSEIVGLEPCTLCWYQRIFSYSTVAILGLALWKKKRDVIPYSMILSLLGFFFAAYHVFIQFNSNVSSVFCSPNATVSCEDFDFIALGYITMPLMSATIFLTTISLLFLASKYNENK